jgi:ribosomal protein S18 acetylase RimI-like enzyme
MSEAAAAEVFTIRRWTEGDRPDDLLALVHGAFGALAINPPSSALKETLDDMAARTRTQTVMIAQARGRLVGSVFCVPEAGALYISRLAVAADWRGRGVGRALMEAARTEARRLRASRLTLRVRIALTGNVAFFRRLGFVVVGEETHAGFAAPTSYAMALDLRNG